jgi:lysophospholipid hydrolase
VFHELARHLQTRRLIAGDTLQLDSDKNFYCVVDGLVQVYARSGELGEDAEPGGAWAEEDLNGYHLLNEVGSGGTLSSLFTILSLFTENVTLAWPEPEQDMDDLSLPVPDQPSNGHPDALGRSRTNSEISQLDLSQDSPGPDHRQLRDTAARNSLSSASISSGTSTVHGFEHSVSSSRPLSRPSVSTPERTSERPDSRNQRPQSSRRPTRPAGLDSVGGSIARASVDTTLAVIPAGESLAALLLSNSVTE